MEFEKHCSLAGVGSWTDLLTNVSAIRQTHLAGNVEALLRHGEAPREMTLDLLHEATHQWCFASPVGSVLAYLHARVVHVAMLEHAGYTVPFGEFYEDLIRLETTRELLRPLAEGLAMFIELDATTGPDSDSLSLPFQTAFQLFLDRASVSSDHPPAELTTSELQRILREARLTRDGIRRRVNLLSQPLSVDAGGYLPGYLALKSLWLECVQASDDSLPLNESDLFAAYVRAYFYRDFALVDLLLDPSTSGVESVQAIADYLTRRMASFVSDVEVPEDLYRYEALASRSDEEIDPEGYYLDPVHFLHVDEEKYLRAANAWLSIKRWMVSDPHDELDEAHQHMQRTLNQSRHYLHLATGTGRLTVDPAGDAVFTGPDGRELWRSRAQAWQEGSGPGRIEVFCSTYDPLARMVGLYGERGLLSTSLVGHSENASVPLGPLMAEYHDVVELRGLLADKSPLVTETLQRHGVDELVERLRTNILPVLATRLYWGAGLARVSWDLNARHSEIARDGLLLLPGSSRLHFEGAALLGLAASAGLEGEQLESLFTAHRLSLPDTLSWLERAHEQTGFPVLVSGGGSYYTNL